MLYLAVFVLIFTGLRFITAASNLLFRQWLRSGKPLGSHEISILIPARNEEKNIETILESILQQDYPHWEAIVYDDISEDRTAELVKRYEAMDKRIRLISGDHLEPGWMGKNHACHKLSLEANGDYFLFTDADVEMEPGLLRDALAQIQRYRLNLLSIFPKQIMKSMGEKMTVPIMNWILVSLLPMILTRVSRHASLSAGNGQFMMFDAHSYREHLFHSHFRNQVAEDISIARFMKQIGLRIHTILSRGQVKCRMYRSLGEAKQGFAKNIIAFFGAKTTLSIFFLLVTTLGIIPVWIAMGLPAAIVYLAATSAIRAMVSAASSQNIWFNVLMAPIQHIMFINILGLAIHNKINKKNTWKGRKIDI